MFNLGNLGNLSYWLQYIKIMLPIQCRAGLDSNRLGCVCLIKVETKQSWGEDKQGGTPIDPVQ